MKNQYAELDRFVYSLLDKVKVMKYVQNGYITQVFHKVKSMNSH